MQIRKLPFRIRQIVLSFMLFTIHYEIEIYFRYVEDSSRKIWHLPSIWVNWIYCVPKRKHIHCEYGLEMCLLFKLLIGKSQDDRPRFSLVDKMSSYI
jgi:hypothetical protein